MTKPGFDFRDGDPGTSYVGKGKGIISGFSVNLYTCTHTSFQKNSNSGKQEKDILVPSDPCSKLGCCMLFTVPRATPALAIN